MYCYYEWLLIMNTLLHITHNKQITVYSLYSYNRYRLYNSIIQAIRMLAYYIHIIRVVDWL